MQSTTGGQDAVLQLQSRETVKLGDFGTGVVGVKSACQESFTTFENTAPELLTDGDTAVHVRRGAVHTAPSHNLAHLPLSCILTASHADSLAKQPPCLNNCLTLPACL